EEILQPTHEYLKFNQQAMAEHSEAGQTLAQRLIWGLLLFGTLGPIVGVIAGFRMAHNVQRSLLQLSVPVRDAAGKLNEVVGPITVSAGRDLEDVEAALHGMTSQVSTVIERLQQSQKEAIHRQQLAMVGQLAAGIAHEMRNPLQCMQLLVQ